MKSSPSNAFSFPEVRVVEASAGSGKTFALAKRYIQLLLHPSLTVDSIPMRSILAITFTNKAAFEMKSRILEFLKCIALKKLSAAQDNEILKPLGISQEEASGKAFQIMEVLIHHYNFFQVQTIDKFINALLSGCAFKIGLTANFKIKTNSYEYLEYSLDQLIDQAAHHKELSKIFQYFLHNYLYLENRTGWFPKEDMLSIMLALFRHHNTYGLDFKKSSLTPEDLIKKKKSILAEMKTLRSILPESTDLRFVKSFDKFLANTSGTFDVDSLSDYFLREAIPIKKGTEVSDEADKLWVKIRSGIQQVCEEEAYSLFNPYVQLYSYVATNFYQLSAKDDVLFLEELNKRASRLFDNEYVTVEELYFRLATRFRHYLIDEFQDTSRLQWLNIEKMAEEALATGGSLFYVGDRKQAIYGFRGGEVTLFDQLKTQFDAFNIKVDYLTNNWRSQRAIVEFNNSIFSLDNLKRFIREKETYEEEKNKRGMIAFSDDDFNALADIFKGAQQTFQPKYKDGYVKIEYIGLDKKEDRDEEIRTKVVSLVKDLRNRFSYRDIAILTRSNQQIEDLTNWLLAEGILVESERTSSVKENHLIKELISFLKFLDSPIDNLSFASFILGDIFKKASGLSESELHTFVFKSREHLANNKDAYLYMAFRQAYPEVWERLINEFFKNVGLYPLYELVISIYHRLNCLINFSEAQGFLMHFLELIKEEEEDHGDITSFLDYFEQLEGADLFVAVTDTDAVKILTVHKAKGLEFPIVIIPFLGMDVQVGSQGADQQQSYIVKRDSAAIELIRLKTKYLSFSEELYQIYADEYKKALLTELNNVYVALTRAQYELYAFIPKRIQNSFNLVKFLIPEDNFEAGVQHTYDIKLSAADSIKQLPPSQYHDWIDYLKDEFLDLNELKNREERRRGEILHFMLSFVGNLKEANKKEIIHRAAQEAKTHFAQTADLTAHVNLLNQLLDEPALKQFFYVDADVKTEQDVVNAVGHPKRIDRLIIKKDEIIVVDYKSSAHPQDVYRDQVKDYCLIVREMYPKHRVKGYLIYLDSFKVEEVL